MIAKIDRPSNWVDAAVVAVAAGVFLFLLLPSEVTTVGDDFGYYKSIVETIQHARPWTDGWLEPWAASLSVISALIFRATGNFLLATYGLQSVLFGAGLTLFVVLLMDRGHTRRGAVVMAFLLGGMPTILWKSAEFTGMVLYLPCLLGAILAAERRRWIWFFSAWAIAVATRQNAVAWLIMPVWEVLQSALTSRKRLDKCLPEVYCVIGGLAFFALLMLGMNKSHAQTVITEHILDHLALLRVLKIAAIGGLAYLIAAGCSAMQLRLLGRLSPSRASAIAQMGVLGIFLAVAFWRIDPRQWVLFEHSSYNGAAGCCYFLVLIGIGMVGWVGRGIKHHSKLAVYALANLVLLCLRADLWDYYLSDIIVFGLLSVSTPSAPVGLLATERRGRAWFNVLAVTLWTAGAVFNLWNALQFKLRLDLAHGTNSVVEHAFREGKVTPMQLYGTTFGFVAWHLQPYFATHEGRNDPKIAHFWNYLLYSINIRTRGSGVINSFEPFKSAPPPDSSRWIRSEKHTVLWMFEAEFFLERAIPISNPPPHVPMRMESYHRIPYPLDNNEWRQLIENERL